MGKFSVLMGHQGICIPGPPVTKAFFEITVKITVADDFQEAFNRKSCMLEKLQLKLHKRF